jgi:hypothetical protein
MQRLFTILFITIQFVAHAQPMQQGGCVSWNLPANTSVCSSQNVFYLTGGTPSGGTYSGSGVFDGLFFPSLAGVGTHTITYTVNNGTCNGTATGTIQVIAPEPIILSGDFEICIGESATITALNGNDVEWSDNTMGQTATFSPLATDTYTVYAYDDNNCLSSDDFEIVVNALPSIFISGNTDVCNGFSTTLTAFSIDTYSWSTGGTEATIEYTPATTGSVCVSGMDNNGCISSQCVMVTLHNDPQITIAGDNQICMGESTPLQALGATQFLWNNNSQANILNVSPTTNTVYSVIGTDGFGCEGSASIQVTVNPNPVAVIQGIAEGCEQQSIELIGSGAISILWSNGSTSTAANFVLVQNEIITLTVTNEFNCSDETSISTVVHPLPEISIEGNTVFCEGDSVMLTAVGNANFLWQNGSTQNNVSFVAADSEIITLVGTTAFGCEAMATHAIEVNAAPDMAYTGNATVCPGEQASIEVSGAADYLWSNGNSTNSFTYSPAQNELLTIVGTSEMGCQDSIAVNIIVFDAGDVFIDGNITPCPGDTIIYTAMGADSYLWNAGEASNSIVYVANADTTFGVMGTSSLGCFAYAEIQIAMATFPEVTIAGNSEQCVGDELILIAEGAQDYVWNNGSINDTLLVVASVDALYSVVGYNAFGCADTSYHMLEILPQPLVTFSLSQDTLCTLSGPIVLQGSPAGGIFEGDGVTGNTLSAAALPAGIAVITYSYTNDFGCMAVANDSIVVEICEGLLETVTPSLTLYPNPANEVLNVQASARGNLVIYDISGKQVLAINNTSGIITVPIQHLSAGLYTCTFVNMQGEVVQQKFQKL